MHGMRFTQRMKAAYRMVTKGELPADMPEGLHPASRAGQVEPLTLSTVFRGVQVLQTAITGLPLNEYRNGVAQSRCSPIIARPDTRRSRRDFIADLVASMVIDGNAFILTSQLGGEIVDCRILPPQLVTVTQTNTDPSAPALEYSFNGATYTAGRVIHLKFLNVPGRLRGMGPISAAREEIEGARMARDYKARFYTDASNIKGYLKTDKTVTRDMAKEAKRAWSATGDALDVKVIGSNLSYVPLELKPADLQFLETQKFDTTQIARLLGIPASIMLAAVDGSNLTYSNIEQSWIEFSDYTLAAYTGEIEEALNQLLPEHSTVHFDWDSSRRADMNSRYTAYRTAIEAGWLTVNEVRDREGLQPLSAEQLNAPHRKDTTHDA